MIALTSWLVISAVLLFNPAAPEKVPSSPEELMRSSTHVVVGRVTDLRSESDFEGTWTYQRYELEIAVESVEKGSGVAPGDRVRARCWTKSWNLPTTPPPDTSGHSPLPWKGERGRAHLVNDGYNGFGTTTDGRFDLFGRNGWEPLDPRPAGGGPAPGAGFAATGSALTLVVLALGALLAVLGLAFLLLRRRRGTARAAG